MSHFWWTINKAFCNSVTGNKKKVSILGRLLRTATKT